MARLLVTPEELEAWLEAGGARPLVVLDARAPGRYARGHLPGAVNLPMAALFDVDPMKGLKRLKPLNELEGLFGRAGLTPEAVVVIYGERGNVDAANVFWALESCGHPNAMLLDGGIERWAREGRPLVREPAAPEPRRYSAPEPEARARVRVEADWLLAHLDDPEVQILDNRSPEEYTGEERYARRGGHLPGAKLLPYERTLNPDGTFRPAAEIRELYERLGLDPAKTVVNYCQTGTRSAHAYFTQRLVGFRDPRVYEGSWAEWGNDERFPVER